MPQSKAIIMAGAPGSGKGYILDQLNLPFQILNLDDYYETILKEKGLHLDIKMYNAEERSISSKAMWLAKTILDEKIKETIMDGSDFILDGTSSSYNKTWELIDLLIQSNYKVAMIYVYAPLKDCLNRNNSRYINSNGNRRSLYPKVVMTTWTNVTSNYNKYKELLGPNFITINNSSKGIRRDKLEDLITRYIDPFKYNNTNPKSKSQRIKELEVLAKTRNLLKSNIDLITLQNHNKNPKQTLRDIFL